MFYAQSTIAVISGPNVNTGITIIIIIIINNNNHNNNNNNNNEIFHSPPTIKTKKQNGPSELRSSMKVQVAAPARLPSLIIRTVSMDVMQH